MLSGITGAAQARPDAPSDQDFTLTIDEAADLYAEGVGRKV